ncbi:helicase-associated domain-containing protein [Paenibacillus thiaminolyticus]|uniref:Helicase-associated domain-containing protein n=1 Tax=Paenibacillus thiaminolyticus TaxID=49283 RepID=A0AAP9E119_PANTH|nr:helicase-associated domain-containing protein [Paenibacillus thiaminolyticus]MCY9534459.1 helicase-associated domain-containing protein [Paenibacillus thiaminolyticus]MCY9601269.1 helicase-associated domain-containing protein [Paenibacillus thiaminolyticus]MCY9606502.1 helicase-associated domain-containing protein [Paenibacillus thiaminolyticus]MCY9614102.1 helicase-associated domain-containing protein [Paenibacillus thiaminolyticus]MCY9618639.1 helicase-associated domain-containing protein
MNTIQLLKRTEPDEALAPRQCWERYAQGPEAVREEFRALQPPLRIPLVLMLKQAGPLPFTVDKLLSWHGPEAAGSALLAACDPLAEHGFVASVKRAWGDRLLFLPSDVYAQLLGCLLDDLHPGEGRHPEQPEPEEEATGPVPEEQAKTHGPEPEGYQSEAGRGIVFGLFSLLVFAAKEGLPLTAKGTLHKRAVTRLSALNPWASAELPNDMGAQYPFADTLPLPLALVIDIALRFGLLKKEANRYAVNEPELARWLRLPPSVWREAVMSVVEEHYLPADAQLRHLVLAVRLIGADGAWHEEREVIGRLIRLGLLDAEDAARAERQLRGWLRTFHAFGFCHLARPEQEEGEWAYRLPEQDMAEGAGFFIQPDFEILLPAAAPFYLRWELEAFAECVRTDQMDVYRLTKASFEQGVEHGRTMASVLRFMEAHAWSGVPENIQDAMELWSLQYGRVRFAEVMLLRCEDSAVAVEVKEALLREPSGLAGIELIGDRDFIVDRDRVRELGKTLDKAGIAPLRQWAGKEGTDVMISVWEEASADLGASPEDAGKAMVYSPSPLQYYEMETEPLLGEDLAAPYREVPGQWTRTLRSYHASTQKDLVSMAIRLLTPIEVEQSGQCATLIPVRIRDGEKGAWLLEAYDAGEGDAAELKTWSPADWERQRLVLPAGCPGTSR